MTTWTAKNKTLYVMVGLPGSGKSTYIKNMGVDAVILSTDDYIEQKAKEDGLTYSDVFETYIKDAEKNLKANLAKAIEDGSDIIWDQTNLRIKKRKSILQQVPSHYKKVAIQFDTPMDVIMERLKKRGEDTGKVIAPSIVFNMNATREMIQYDEGFDEIHFIPHVS